MLANIPSCALLGIDALVVWVEVEVAQGLPGYQVVGMPAPSVREGAVRIRSALEQVGHAMPAKKVTVNLAPADLRKSGTAFDLPIAVGVLVADGIAPLDALAGLLLLGELGLDGSLRAARGVLAAALLVRERGLRGILVPSASASEAMLVAGIEVYAAAHLGEVVAALAGGAPLRRVTADNGALVTTVSSLGTSGRQVLEWDGRGTGGRLVPPGVYLCRLHVDTDRGVGDELVRLVSVVY